MVEKTNYKSQTFIDPKFNSCTDSIVCYDGNKKKGVDWEHITFVKFTDSNGNTTCISKRPDETLSDFVVKLARISLEINNLMEHLTE